MHNFDSRLMRQAIELSRKGMQANDGGPFGAVIVRHGEVIATGNNQVASALDPTMHAEIVAIREACRKLGTFELTDCKLYSSCEPCPMCLGAIYWSRLSAVYFANTRDDARAIGFDDAFIYDEIVKPPAERTIPFIKVDYPEARAVFEEWKAKPDKVEY
jgi:guanine deaminase